MVGYAGARPATCMARSRTSFWNSSLRATKSVSQLTSMSTPEPAAGMDVGGDEALAGVAAGLLGGRCLAPLAEQDDGLLEVAVRLLEGALAVHEAGAGALAELLDGVGA